MKFPVFVEFWILLSSHSIIGKHHAPSYILHPVHTLSIVTLNNFQNMWVSVYSH